MPPLAQLSLSPTGTATTTPLATNASMDAVRPVPLVGVGVPNDMFATRTGGVTVEWLNVSQSTTCCI